MKRKRTASMAADSSGCCPNPSIILAQALIRKVLDCVNFLFCKVSILRRTSERVNDDVCEAALCCCLSA